MEHHMDLVATVRLLAMGEMVPTDAGIACFDSKYHYLFWRPITAIRADGDPADATWSPPVTMPNHPEYPSQHGCVTSALAKTLAVALGTRDFSVTIPGAENGASTLTTSRTYADIQDLDTELVNHRVWIGFHYRNSVKAGENLGTDVATWALARFFLPGDDRGEIASITWPCTGPPPGPSATYDRRGRRCHLGSALEITDRVGAARIWRNRGRMTIADY